MQDSRFAAQFTQLVGEWSQIDPLGDDASMSFLSSNGTSSTAMESVEQTEQADSGSRVPEVTCGYEAVLDVLRQSLSERIDFYPKDQILRVQPVGQEALEVFADDGVMASSRDIIKRRGLHCKFCSHLRES